MKNESPMQELGLEIENASYYNDNGDTAIDYGRVKDLIEKYLEKEKAVIIEACDNNYKDEFDITGKQYYKETFK